MPNRAKFSKMISGAILSPQNQRDLVKKRSCCKERFQKIYDLLGIMRNQQAAEKIS